MLDKWSFPWYTLLSASFSLLSLAWSNTALEKARLAKDGHDLSKMEIVLHFISQLLVLTPRLFVITICAHGQRSDVFIFLLMFWVFGAVLLGCLTCWYTTCTVCCGNSSSSDRSIKTFCGRLILSLLLTFYVSETVLEALEFSSTCIKMVLFITKSAENFSMICLGLYAADRPISSVLKTFVWTMFGIGVLFGAVLPIARLYLRHKQDSEDLIDDVNNKNCQSNDYDKPNAASLSSTSNDFDREV